MEGCPFITFVNCSTNTRVSASYAYRQRVIIHHQKAAVCLSQYHLFLYNSFHFQHRSLFGCSSVFSPLRHENQSVGRGMRRELEFLNSPIFSENVTRLTCFPTHAPFSSQGLGMWSSLTPLLFQLGLQSAASAEISSCVDLDEALCGLGPFVVGIEACVACAVTLCGCYFESQVHYLGGG